MENKKEKRYRGLVAFDLDNTLLDHESWKIADSALRAIDRLKEEDYLTVIASGRNMKDADSIQYLRLVKPDAVVYCNGTRVEASEHTLIDHVMAPELLKRVLDFAIEKKHSLGARLQGQDYFTCVEGVIRHDVEYWGKSQRNFADPYGLLKLPVRALTYAGGSEGASELRGAFPELEVMMFSKDTGADIFEKGYSKADGLQALCEYFDIPAAETYAFGDSFNDECMIRWAEKGIAVGNALEELKKAADYVTAPIAQDGIAKALKHFELI